MELRGADVVYAWVRRSQELKAAWREDRVRSWT